MLMVIFSCSNNSQIFYLLENSDIGIAFENNLTYTEEFNAYLFRSFYNGAGVGLADVNNDGYLDLFLCGNQQDNKLYIGDGNFNFRDVTDHAGVASPGSWTTGVSIVDINQDGWKDIYVCKSGRLEDPNRRNELFINNGLDENGLPTFTESANKYGIDDLGFSIHAVFFDYDRDGDLDMYLSNNSYNPSEVIIDAGKGMREKRDPAGGNKLYRNEGNYFVDVTVEVGIYSSAIGFGLGISIADVNRDGWPDIYVANDFFEKDYLYVNQGDGTFIESIDHWTSEISLGSMGVDIADMNHDGFPEIFVTEMLPEDEGRLKTKTVFDTWDKYSLKVKNGYHRQFPRNSFQLNNGRYDATGTGVYFSEISRYAGVAASDWSWGAQLIDLDRDGNKEIFITNGIGKDLLDLDYLDFYDNPAKLKQILKDRGEVMTELFDNMPSEAIANHLYRLDSNLVFTNVASELGLGQPGFSSGSAYGDIDNDGDIDLVVNNLNGPPFIYRNDLADGENHFITLSLKKQNGTTAIGAQVSVWAGGKLYYEELYPMRGVMSVVDDRLHIGLGKAKLIDRLEILWPDGSIQQEKNLPVDRFLTIAQPIDDGGSRVSNKALEHPILSDVVCDGLHFAHKESNFVDFDRDHLLFNMVSNEGPRIAVADVNGDGLDDCYIGGAKGQPGALFIQRGPSFVKTNEALFEANRQAEDQQAIFFDADNDGDNDLLVASGSYEFSSGSFALVDKLYLNDGQGEFTQSNQVLPSGRPTNTSVVIHADYDQDGDEDLFFGSRSVPGLYGVPASGYLLENTGAGQFTDVTEKKAPGLVDLGMVTDAVWSDIDGDDDLDLVVVGEWMPVRVFINDRGSFKELQNVDGIERTNGFWNTITASDLDNDGDEDFIIGNMGYNTFFKASNDKPVEMYINDFDQNGSIEHIITTYRNGQAYPVAMKDEITKQLPHLLKKYLKHFSYQRQTINDIFSEEEIRGALMHKVFETGSCIFWNEDGRLVKQRLPFEAQLAPVYSIYSSDINNDGLADIVLGGNQHNAKPQTGIYAASYGVVFLNAGNRAFKRAGPENSGFKMAGQIRDMEKISIGGKDHLMVARNNDSLKLMVLNRSWLSIK